MSVEFRVRKVTRFVVTKYVETPDSAVISTLGPFDNLRDANAVADALSKAEPGSTAMLLDEAVHACKPEPIEPRGDHPVFNSISPIES